MNDTQILDWISANLRTIDQSGALVIIVLNGGESFQGYNVRACVAGAVAAGF